MPTLICSREGCNNKTPYIIPIRIRKSKTGKFYCSQKCYGKTLGEQKKKYSCTNCKKKFYDYPSQLKRNKHSHCCSPQCSYIIRKMYPITLKLRHIIQRRKCNIKAKETLNDSYIAHTIANTIKYYGLKISTKDIPKEFIKAKRMQLANWRQAKQKLK